MNERKYTPTPTYCAECYQPTHPGRSHRPSDWYACPLCNDVVAREQLDRHADQCELIVLLAIQGIGELTEWMRRA